MVYIDLKYRADLTKPIPEQSISAPFVYGESQAHRFWVENIRSSLEGSVTGQFIRPDGNAVVLTDSGGFTGIENGKAWVVLASECYAFGGYARLIVNVTNGAQVTTVLNVRLTVGEAISGVQVDPGNAINLNLSDINTIVAQAAKAEAEANKAAASAAAAAASAETAQNAFVNFIDPTLTAEEKAAPAKVVGDLVNEVGEINQSVGAFQDEQTEQNTRITALENRPTVDKSLTRRVENLEAAARGQLYRAETDSDEAYEKALPSDVLLPWATMDKLGAKTLAWNQLAKNPTFDGFGEWTVYNCTVSTSNGVVTVTNASKGAWNGIRQSVKCELGHAYLGMCDLMSEKVRFESRNISSVGFVKGNIATDNNTYDTVGAWKTVYQIMQITEVRDSGAFQIYPFNYTDSEVGDVAYVKNARVFDLTAMFGAGNEPTAEEFRAMFPADYYPYSEPTLMSFEPHEVVSRGRNLLDVNENIKVINANGVYRDGYRVFCNKNGNYTIEVENNTSQSYYYGLCTSNDIPTQLGSIPSTGKSMKTVTATKGDYIVLWSGTSEKLTSGFIGIGNSISYRDPIITDLSSIVQKYFPDGMKSAGYVHDEIDLERGVAVQRVGRKPMSLIIINSVNMPLLSGNAMSDALPKLNSENVVDSAGSPNNGVWGQSVKVGNIPTIYWTYINTKDKADAFVEANKNGYVQYELADPIETPIDPADLTDLANLNVEAGGSLTFANQHGDDYRVPLPNQETWMIKLGGDA